LNATPPRRGPLRTALGLWRRWRDELAIAGVLALLAALLALGSWTWRLDRLVYDLGLALWGRPPPADIVIVAIDDASIAAIGRWPWRRAVHATLLDQLTRARPRAVALDLVLSDPDDDPAQDTLLAAALARAAPVVLPVALQGIGTTVTAAAPAGPLRAAARLGVTDTPVDPDGVLRSGFLQAGPPGALMPTFAVALLQAGGESVRADLPIERSGPSGVPTGARARDGRLFIRYVGPPGTVERVSYVDVLSGTVPASRLAGRYVLVGATATGLGDTLATPVNRRHHAMPGIEVHANLLYTLRSGDTLAELPPARLALLSAVLVALLVAAFGFFGPRTALPAAVVSLPLAVGASLLALRWGWSASPVPYVLSAVLAYPLWSWRRLERALAGLDREIARLATEPLVVSDGMPRVAALPGDAIAERLRTLQRAGGVLRQARRFLADTLAAMPTAMVVADGRAHVLQANPRAAALFEVDDVDEMHGLDLVRLLAEFTTATPFDWPAAMAALEVQGGGIAVEARGAGGGDYVVHVAAVDLQGERRLVVTIADVEPVKRAQRDREEVLAFVSHDLRSPANSIVLLADLHLQGAMQTPTAELLAEMRRLAAQTLAMSEDFVRAAQAQTQPLQTEAADPAALIEGALADLRAQAAAAQVVLQAACRAGDARPALDRLLLSRAIGNLVSNAIKHSPPGGVVEVGCSVAGGRLLVQVRDHGSGLSPQQLAQIARGDAGAAVQDMRGVGLGLLFVQRVARRHGGRLVAGAPPQGAGALFELQLPA